ncbi:MAG: hypothetical protein DMD35_06780 [Gemmatimonadetes bacterium]|nr:MAG: hypothetical protein DMD35_06780 [Gemmatimonadota bacterium]
MHGLRGALCVLALGWFAQPTVPVAPRVALRVGCDSLVLTHATDPLAYRQRGDRCEGVYGQKVSGSSTLRVASLVESLEAFDDSSSSPLLIEWTAPTGAPVAVRASAIRAGLYYRMETARPIAAHSFSWPADVRRPLRIRSTDIGVIGVTSMTLGGRPRDVLVPLRISQRRPPTRSSRYRLTLWPTIGLSDVFLTVAATGADGAPTRYLQRDVKLTSGLYPAERPIAVRLPELEERGVYLVRVAATREAGGGVTTSFLLYHAGRTGEGRQAP